MRKKKTRQKQTLPSSTPFPPDIEAWRVFRIMGEFVEGFEKLTSLGPSVVVFGSTHFKQNHPYYKLAESFAKKIVKKGFGITTGGGPGIMEAANKGARAAKGSSCGICIDLPEEEKPNLYIDEKYLLKFHYFFVRKVMFVRYALAFVAFPGGYGTIDELFECLTLIQTGKTKTFPVFLIGKEYWAGLYDWIKEKVYGTGKISAASFKLISISDDLDDVVDQIEKHYKKIKSLENF